MSPNRNSLDKSELRNKDETEVPIGEPREADNRGHNMWRCIDCGEMGRFVDSLPDACPACESPKEELYYWEED
ncbi:DUF7130 family rubredoxin-like protein [Natronococcus jeotgali]|uniref:DUF7130 domain-containing protein n=1 Tax=Natronococcus jeotgali DSM 18795 TaxID=1227498 RepID=L9XGM8_9EURY|nr:hypothetical protein [Natronococcus jeotgali]ELY60875.1 hypothetical protein C492_10255 [Natronococcus jeotgali DSM 18795]